MRWVARSKVTPPPAPLYQCLCEKQLHQGANIKSSIPSDYMIFMTVRNGSGHNEKANQQELGNPDRSHLREASGRERGPRCASRPNQPQGPQVSLCDRHIRVPQGLFYLVDISRGLVEPHREGMAQVVDGVAGLQLPCPV